MAYRSVASLSFFDVLGGIHDSFSGMCEVSALGVLPSLFKLKCQNL